MTAGWSETLLAQAAVELRRARRSGRLVDAAAASSGDPWNKDHPRILLGQDWMVREQAHRVIYLVLEEPLVILIPARDPSVTDMAVDLEDESIWEEATIGSLDRRPENQEGMTESLWHLSIVYSHVYQVPVLYFAVQYRDGSPCPWDVLVSYMQRVHHQNCVNDSHEFLSMDQHPATGDPSFFLHPCMTRDRMDCLATANTNTTKERCAGARLLSWLSMILPSIGLSIPPQQYLALRKILDS